MPSEILITFDLTKPGAAGTQGGGGFTASTAPLLFVEPYALVTTNT